MISGGAFHARTRINETNLTGFVPPEFSAGCGGIDLYGGSFSFINSEQFNKLIRDIAGNASGYLLGLALSAMNEKAYQHIEALQEKIMHLNSLFSNSCQMGQGRSEQYADACGYEEVSDGCIAEYQPSQCCRYVPVIYRNRIIKP